MYIYIYIERERERERERVHFLKHTSKRLLQSKFNHIKEIVFYTWYTIKGVRRLKFKWLINTQEILRLKVCNNLSKCLCAI